MFKFVIVDAGILLSQDHLYCVSMQVVTNHCLLLVHRSTFMKTHLKGTDRYIILMFTN